MTPNRTTRQAAAVATTLSLLLGAAACGGDSSSSKEVTAPAAASDLDGKNYEDVVTQFKSAGFTNVKTEADPDLVTGWVHHDGEVEAVAIAGNTDFSGSDHFDPATAVVVRYHTFPADATASPTPSAEPAGTAGTTEAEVPTTSAETASAPAVSEKPTADSSGGRNTSRIGGVVGG